MAAGMHPLVGGAVLVGVLAALGSLASRNEPRSAKGAPPPLVMLAPCPPGSLPEGGICVPLPPRSATPRPDDATSERIPRRPDRPEKLEALTLPLEPALPPTFEGPGLRLPAPPGAPVRALALEGQEGQAEVVFAGPMPGGEATLVTAHRVAEGGRTRTYLLFLVGLRDLSEALVRGSPAPAGAIAGEVAGEKGLYLEARSVREGIQLAAVPPERLGREAISVATDARNVLPSQPLP